MLLAEVVAVSAAVGATLETRQTYQDFHRYVAVRGDETCLVDLVIDRAPLVDAAKAASLKYGVEELPSLVMIDKEGNVRAFLTGLVDEASLNEIITAAL